MHYSNALNLDRPAALRIRALSQLSPARGIAAIAADWFAIATSIAIAVVTAHPVMWLVAAVVVAMRQHALLIIMHDASHYRLLNSRQWNDRLSNWLLAWPLLVTTEGYRQNHLAHHLHLNTENDPDWLRKRGNSDWRFPKTKRALLTLLVRDLCGGGVVDQLRAVRELSNQKTDQRCGRATQIERFLYYLGAAVVVIYFDVWWQTITLWFFPAFTLLPVILRIRSIAEHFGVEGDTELNASRNMHPNWWERLTVAPHSVGYHLDHHLYPGVPFYNLSKLHGLLAKQPEYAAASHQSQSLFGSAPSSVLNEVSVAD